MNVFTQIKAIFTTILNWFKSLFSKTTPQTTTPPVVTPPVPVITPVSTPPVVPVSNVGTAENISPITAGFLGATPEANAILAARDAAASSATPQPGDNPYTRPPFPSYTAFDFTESEQAKTLPAGTIPAGKYQLVCQNLVSGTYSVAVPGVGTFSQGAPVVELPSDVTQAVVCTSHGDKAHGQGTLCFKPIA